MPLARPNPYAQLYLDHHGWLLGWLGRRLDCRETAADLAQDTFLRLIRRQGCCPQAMREPRAFLTTVAHGLVVSHWRRRDIERAYLEALASRPFPVAISPEDQELVLESLYQVDAMLSRLPEKVRRAFLMAQLDGLTYRRIGEVLGVSERMVKKYMAQAMYHCLTLKEAA